MSAGAEWLNRNRGGTGRQAPGGPVSSRQNLVHHAAAHIGESEVAAGVAVRQLLVVQAEEVQQGRVQVVDVDLVLGGVVPVVVRRPVAEPAFDSAAGQPNGEPLGVVVAAVG